MSGFASPARAWTRVYAGSSFSLLAVLGLAGCTDDADDGQSSSMDDTGPQVWTAWTVEGQGLEVDTTEGLLSAGRGSSVTSAPEQTLSEGAISIDPKGAVSYAPAADHWGGDRFDYEVDGENRTGHISVLPRASYFTWTPIAGRPIFTGWRGGDRFGATLLNAGDMDGDGDDELLVGAPLADAGLGPLLNDGAIVIVPGRQDGSFSVGGNWIYGSGDDQQSLGSYTCAAGDLDGDGLGDIGAAGYSRLWTITGRPDLSGLATSHAEEIARLAISEIPTSRMRHLECGLDLIGDATPDLVIAGWEAITVIDGAYTGTHTYDELIAAGAGRTFVVFVPSVQDTSVVPDLDGDGKAELGYAYYGSSSGPAAGVMLSADLSVHDLVRDEDSSSVGFGDFDGDGALDVAIGGYEYVRFYMAVDLASPRSTPDFQVGPFPDAQVEQLVTTDLDGNGIDDLTISAPWGRGPLPDELYGAGVFAGLFGSPELSSTTVEDLAEARSGFLVASRDTYVGFGLIAPAFGDFDGDGVPDMALSAPDHSPADPSGQPIPNGGAVMLVRGFGGPR